jgi:UDP-N-acetylmuramoyl-L-alanyl-D-glutamate--2,6-diaminopimelate ligase
MEASSHGLEQNRLKNIDFDVAIFTNLTLDHLDYHLTFENYKNSKKKLFDQLSSNSYAIVNLDDPNSLDLIKDTKAKIVTYSIQKEATLVAKDIKYSLDGTFFILNYQDKKISFFTKLIGKYNVYNVLCAIATSLILKIDLEKISRIIKDFKNVPGRLEKIENNKNIYAYVDHAHSDDALKNVLSTLKEIKKARLINVFGCGGDRQKSKRPLMAKVSEEFSDISIVTSDNPRSEDPQKIIEEIVKGFSKDAKYFVEKNRAEAIKKAVELAKENDIVIITGKGHETYQIFKNVTIDFDDRKMLKQAFVEKKNDF